MIEGEKTYHHLWQAAIVEILEGNHFSGFKAIHVSYGARKYVVVDHDVEVVMKLI